MVTMARGEGGFTLREFGGGFGTAKFAFYFALC